MDEKHLVVFWVQLESTGKVAAMVVAPNSSTPKSVLAGTKNSCLEGFWLARHKHKNIPTMMEPYPPPAASFCWLRWPHPQEPLRKGLAKVDFEGFSMKL